MNDFQIEPKYKMLFDAARDVVQKNYHPIKHSVGAAVLGASGVIYTGINVESSGHGVCAEPIALGAALSSGEKEVTAVIAVAKRETEFVVLSPCGNCRQMLLDYAPEADVIFADAAGGGGAACTKAKNLLPGAYIAPDFSDV